MSDNPDQTAVPGDLRYGPEHEWSSVRDGRLTMGITDYAQAQLGEVVYLDLTKVGRVVARLEAIAEVESAKAVSDVFAPCSGEVVETNQDLVSAPERINTDPYGSWLVRIRMSDPDDYDKLDDAQTYRFRLSE